MFCMIVICLLCYSGINGVSDGCSFVCVLSCSIWLCLMLMLCWNWQYRGFVYGIIVLRLLLLFFSLMRISMFVYLVVGFCLVCGMVVVIVGVCYIDMLVVVVVLVSVRKLCWFIVYFLVCCWVFLLWWLFVLLLFVLFQLIGWIYQQCFEICVVG